MHRSAAILLIASAIASSCAADGRHATDADLPTGRSSTPETDVTVARLDDLAPPGTDLRPGDVVALRADGAAVEWAERRSGRILRLEGPASFAGRPASADDVEVVARIDVGTSGEQRGLLGHTEIDGRRYAAWTDPLNEHLVVGEIDYNGIRRVVWDGGGTSGGAVGGHLEATPYGRLLLGIGQLTDWARARDGGAIVQLDPDGPPDQEPDVISDGYTNPFAFAVTDAGNIWVADNAVGDDSERIGRADLGDRDDHGETGADPRAPSAIVELTDGTLAICGFLDGALQVWAPTDGDGETAPPAWEPGAILGPCLTGAAVLDSGDVVTATADRLLLLSA